MGLNIFHNLINFLKKLKTLGNKNLKKKLMNLIKIVKKRIQRDMAVKDHYKNHNLKKKPNKQIWKNMGSKIHFKLNL